MKRNLLVVASVISLSVTAHTQDRLPISFKATPGLHVVSYDGLVHRSAEHYAALCAVVDTEMGIVHESRDLHLVFVDQTTSDRIIASNPGRFQGKDFTGAFIAPALILIVGEEEADDTFMHEYLHYLHIHGLVFRGVPLDQVHRRIEETEGYLLASRSYIALIMAGEQ